MRGNEKMRKTCKILSFDVKSLYPSVTKSVAEQCVKDLVLNSDMEVININYKEMSKYLFVMMTPDEVSRDKLGEVLPKRVKISRKPLTTNCLLSNKPEHEEWVLGRSPTEDEKRMMLANTVAIGVRYVMENHTYKMGDDIFLQSEGCPIGLNLSQAVARAVMNYYDKAYLERVQEEGLDMKMYVRYVDDSNQIIAAKELNEDEVVEKLLAIANNILPGIVMEADYPSVNDDSKLPILDMKCWLSETGHAMYTHYEKPMATKQIISARSAHPDKCKRAVHVSELLRRCLNTSRRLDWYEHFVPHLDDYMERMKCAGYHENYRRDVLVNALNVYDTKVNESDSGGIPLNRGSKYKVLERRKDKQQKKRNWNKGRKGACGPPIIIPATPNSELAKMLQEIADQEPNPKLRFKIIEKGGQTIERAVMKPNPIGSEGCDKSDCIVCKENGKNCHKGNVCYTMECKVEGCDAGYDGETHRNAYTRGKEHMQKYNRGDESSFIYKHQVEKHNSQPAKFEMKVVKSFKDPLSRQVTEAVMIKNHKGTLLNSKAEFYQPSIIRVQQEIVNGLQE